MYEGTGAQRTDCQPARDHRGPYDTSYLITGGSASGGSGIVHLIFNDVDLAATSVGGEGMAGTAAVLTRDPQQV